MKEIKLVNNKGIVLVDDKDYETLSHHKWYLLNSKNKKYAITSIDSLTKLMHRIIMKEPKDLQIDHIDGNGLNNKKENLRIVTSSQNNMNRSKFKNSISKFKGVQFENNKWRSRIRLNKKLYHLGMFENEIDAAKAYNKAAKKLFGEYAKLNEVN